MNANWFFLALALFFGGVYVLFRPMELPDAHQGEIAQIELTKFRLYDISTQGLNSVLSAESGKRFSDRYEVERVRYADTTADEPVQMQADAAVYRSGVIDLEGNVLYREGRGFTFHSEEAHYDQNRTLATTRGAFEIDYGLHRVRGEGLYYDRESGVIRASAIDGNFKVDEKEL